jgi:hypothetical protein
LPNAIPGGVGKLIEPLEQTQRLQNRCIDTNTHTGITGFNPLQARPGSECAICDHSHGQTPPLPRFPNICAQFPQYTPNGG